jgi:hypothetical protein
MSGSRIVKAAEVRPLQVAAYGQPEHHPEVCLNCELVDVHVDDIVEAIRQQGLTSVEQSALLNAVSTTTPLDKINV